MDEADTRPSWPSRPTASVAAVPGTPDPVADPATNPATPYLPATVAEAARRFGDRPAFVDPDGTALTYADLHRRSDEIAAGMARHGVGPGAIVGLTLASTSDWVVAYAAAAKAGAATAGVNPRLTDVERAACLDKVEPALVLDDPDQVRSLAVAGGRPAPIGADNTGHANAANSDRPVAVVFTSGTTGTPKGAWFTDRQLRAVTRYDVGEAWGTDRLIPQYGATQFAHVGFTTKLPWYLRLGTTTYLLARWRAGDVLDLVARERIPTLGGVAPQVALLLRDPDFDARDLACVQLIVMGGSASPPALVAEARQRFGAAYSIRWSATETGGVGTGTAPDAPDSEALHTVGRPRTGIDIEIRGDDGNALPHGEVGQVWIRSEASMSGYWGDPEATAHALVNGWLRTGDLGSVDATSLLTLAGRQGEMFIRGGYNVFPSEVAAELGTHPGVHDVVVVPRPDDVLGEIGVAVVVPTDRDHPPTLAELRDHAKARLSHHKLPEALLVVDELPLTAMQKVDRRRLIRDIARTI